MPQEHASRTIPTAVPCVQGLRAAQQSPGALSRAQVHSTLSQRDTEAKQSTLHLKDLTSCAGEPEVVAPEGLSEPQ